MRALRSISKILMLFPIGLLIYDLSIEWFVRARIKVRSLQEFWSGVHKGSYEAARPLLNDIIGSTWATKIFGWPAPLSLAIIPVALYIVYWIWFKMKGGHSTGAFTYRSHD